MFDRGVRLLLRENRIAAALELANRSDAHAISSVFAAGSGLSDPYRVSSRPLPHASAEAQRLLGSNDRLVVEYLLRDALLTWCVSRNRIVVYSRPVRRTALVSAARSIRTASAAERDDLSSVILGSWIDTVSENVTLMFVPAPALSAVPYAMLTAKGKSLVVKSAIATATSVTEFVDAVRNDARRERRVSALFIAAPRAAGSLRALPMADTEVNQAAAVYRDRAVLHGVTRDEFVRNVPRFDIVHFAGHAVVNDRQPLLSALILGRDYFYVHEVTPATFRHARLVVLSGCSTGRTSRPTMSIATALLRNQVPSVVYTLWDVSDDAAAHFAIVFHRSLSSGRSRADAVRDAQLAMEHDGVRDWAAFQLAGAPGRIEPNARENFSRSSLSPARWRKQWQM